ncbi:hypothetical protein [Adlercreutzia sp.]|uniref:hypothetical protein n=1 Tax=Adlercreutzia sp. TaxID=1872387 RepID=UPI003AB1274E
MSLAAARFGFRELRRQSQTHGDGRHQAGAKQQNAARHEAERDKGDAGAEQRAHEPKERAARRFAGKGEPPEVSGSGQGRAEQHVARDHGYRCIFEEHPRPQQDGGARRAG